MHVDQGVSRYFLLLGLVVPSKGRGVAGLARPLATVRLSDDDVLSIHRILLRGSVGSPQAGRGGRLLIGVKSDGSHAPKYGADTLWALLSFREGMSLDELGNYGIVEVPPRLIKGSVIASRSLLEARETRDLAFEVGAVSSPFRRETGLRMSEASLRTGVLVSREVFDWLIDIVPVVLTDEDLSKALFFYQESVRVYRFIEPVEE